jgi:hypothetical protein
LRTVPQGRALAILCVAAAVAWFVIDGFVLSPSFGGTDIYYFKDAGINFAQGLGFASRFTFGNPTFEYHSYSQYPPTYPLLFGLYVKLFGASAESNQVFNSALALCSAISAYAAFVPLLAGTRTRMGSYLSVAVFVFIVFLGYFDAEYDRPDGLGLTMGLAAMILVSKGGSGRRDLIAGCVCALALMTSPFAGIWSSIAVAIIAVSDGLTRGGSARASARLPRLAAGVGLALVIAAILIALLLPDWFGAFNGVLTGSKTQNETGGGYFVALLHGDLRIWARGLPWARPALYVAAAKLAVVQIPLIAALALENRSPEQRFRRLGMAALLAASPLSILLSPYQINYIAMSAALLLAAAACLAAQMPPEARRGYAAAILIGLLSMGALCLPEHLRQLIVRAGTQDSLVRARAFIARNGEAYRSRGTFMAVSSQTYMLWREAGIRPLILIYSGFDNPDNRRLLAWIATAYPGSASLYDPQKPPWLRADEFVLEHQPELPQPLRFLNLWTSRSSQTWESALYHRIREPGQ